MIEDWEAYKALLGPDQYFAILDGLAKSGPYVPEPEDEETWRRELRRAA